LYIAIVLFALYQSMNAIAIRDLVKTFSVCVCWMLVLNLRALTDNFKVRFVKCTRLRIVIP